MFLIRSIAQTQAGRRNEAVSISKEFAAEMRQASGASSSRILTGSIGPADSTIVIESEVESLAQFEKQLDAMNNSPSMERYAKKFAELFISGSHRFEIFRIQ